MHSTTKPDHFPPVRSGAISRTGRRLQDWMNEVPAVSGQLRIDAALVNSTAANIMIFGIAGEIPRTRPMDLRPLGFQRPTYSAARAARLQVWETHEILLMHLSQFLRKHARDFIGLQEVQWMVNRVSRSTPPWLTR